MYHLKKIIEGVLIAIACINIYSCNSVSEQETTIKAKVNYQEIKNLKWLIGNWQNKSAEGTVTESWSQQNDSTFSGNSFFVIGKDTVSVETLTITQNGVQLYYIPTVQGQNNNEPVKFTMTAANDSLWIFENPQHDFPQKISYKKINVDSLVAEISGAKDGKQNVQTFPMGRVK